MDILNKIQKTTKELKLEITKREIQIADKINENARIKEGVLERVEMFKHQMKVQIEQEAVRSYEALEKKMENEIDAQKTRIH
jgi:chromosomal replication initiation ATPase DnaA